MLTEIDAKRWANLCNAGMVLIFIWYFSMKALDLEPGERFSFMAAYASPFILGFLKCRYRRGDSAMWLKSIIQSIACIILGCCFGVQGNQHMAIVGIGWLFAVMVPIVAVLDNNNPPQMAV